MNEFNNEEAKIELFISEKKGWKKTLSKVSLRFAIATMILFVIVPIRTGESGNLSQFTFRLFLFSLLLYSIIN